MPANSSDAAPTKEKATISPVNVIKFLSLVGKLKSLDRSGWVRHGILKPESVASHMYRMSIISLLMPAEPMLRDKVIKMSIVHDLAEAIVGDITPKDGVSPELKYRKEHEAMMKIRQDLLENSDVGQEIYELWKEYEEGRSRCALLCKDIDKFDMVLQAHEYEASQQKDLSEFFESTRGKFKTDVVSEWVSALEEERRIK